MDEEQKAKGRKGALMNAFGFVIGFTLVGIGIAVCIYKFGSTDAYDMRIKAFN